MFSRDSHMSLVIVAIVVAVYFAAIAYFGLGGKSVKSRLLALLIASAVVMIWLGLSYIAASGG
jgi:hypothetical protein